MNFVLNSAKHEFFHVMSIIKSEKSKKANSPDSCSFIKKEIWEDIFLGFYGFFKAKQCNI